MLISSYAIASNLSVLDSRRTFLFAVLTAFSLLTLHLTNFLKMTDIACFVIHAFSRARGAIQALKLDLKPKKTSPSPNDSWQSVKESETQQILMQSSPGAIAILDRNMRYIWVNHRWIQDYHLDKQNLIGRSHYEIFPEIPDHWKLVHQNALRGETLKSYEPFQRHDGKVQYVRWEVSPWRDKSGCIGGITILTEDLTQLHIANREITELNSKLEGLVEERTRELEYHKLIVENMAEGVCLVRVQDGVIVYANPRFRSLFGYAEGEIEGHHVSILNYADSVHQNTAEAQSIMESIKAKGRAVYEVQNIRKDRSLFWCRATTSMFHHPRYGFVFVAVQDDVTTKKQHESNLKASRERYKELFDFSAEGLIECDEAGKITMANHEIINFLGKNVSEMIDLPLSRFFPLNVNLNNLPKKRPIKIDLGEIELISDKGQIRHLEGILRSTLEGRYLISFRDITTRKILELELKTSEQRYRHLVDSHYDSIITIDDKGLIQFANKRFSEQFGYEPGEIIGQSMELLIPLPLRQRHQLLRHIYAKDPKPRSMAPDRCLKALRKDGSEFPVDIGLRPMITPYGQSITAVIRDITMRQRIEDHHRFLAESAHLLNATLDYQERIRRLTDLAVPALADLCAIFEESEPEVFTVLALKGGSCDDSKESHHLNKHSFPNLSSLTNEAEGLRFILIENTQEAGVDRTPHDPGLKKFIDDHQLSSLLILALSTQSENRRIIILGMKLNVRRFSHEDVPFLSNVATRCGIIINHAKLYETSERSVKIRERILSIVSHDLRNPLACIEMVAQSLLDIVPRESTEHVLLEQVQNSCDAMERMIADLLDFSRMESGNLGLQRLPVSIHDVLQRALESLYPRAKASKVQIKLEIQEGTQAILADLLRIVQVIWNIAGNAIKFSPAGGQVTIEAKQLDRMCLVTIKDQGPGMASKDLKKVFDWFWQADERKFQGTGLGLAIAKGIITTHGGEIWVESQLGHGSSFYFTVPSIEQASRV